MGAISSLNGLLTKRFSVWFNWQHTRFWTLWVEPFIRLPIDGGAMQTVAAYIDMNPGQAELTDHAES